MLRGPAGKQFIMDCFKPIPDEEGTEIVPEQDVVGRAQVLQTDPR